MRSYLRDIFALASIEQRDWADRLTSLVASGTPLNADTSTFSAAMKTKFLGPIRDNLHAGRVLLFGGDEANPEGFQGILPSAENIDFVGNEFRIPLKAQRNQAVGFRSEGEVLPAPGASKYTYLSEPMRYAYGLFNITGQLMKASESNEGAFKSAFKQEMEDTVLTSKIDHNRAAFGDGSGKFADVRTNTASTGTVIPISSTIQFRGGEIIDFVLANLTVTSAAHTVTAVDRANRQITITPALGADITTSNFIVRASSDSTTSIPNNSQNKEIQGLKSLIGTSTLHGVNPATYPFWKSYTNAVGGAISDSVIRDGLDNVGFESGFDTDGQGFILITTRGVRRRYADTLVSVKRFVDAQSVKLHGGFTALMFDEHPIYTDDQCDLGYMYGLNVKDFFWAQMSDWDWMDQDGQVLKWDTTRKDRYIAVLYKYCQLGMTRRNASFKLTTITDDTK